MMGGLRRWSEGKNAGATRACGLAAQPERLHVNPTSKLEQQEARPLMRD
jgi:hypothetical protein